MRERESSSLHLAFLILSDALLVNAGYILAFKIRFTVIPAANFNDYVRLIPWIAFLTIILFRIYGLYFIERKSFGELFFSTVLSVFVLNVFVMALTFFYRGFAFPRSVFIIGAIFQVVLISFVRYITLHIIKKIHGVQKVLLIGNKQEAFKIARKFQDIEKGWFDVKYMVCEEDIDTIMGAISLADIVCLCPGVSQELKSEITVAALEKRKKVMVIPELYEVLLSKTKVTGLDDTPVFELVDLNLSREQKILKRAFDIIASFLGLVILSPLILLVALLIKLTSEGPVFYYQERVGEYGRTFKVCKFRTMIKDAEKYTGPVLATENDPRITPLGRILRTFRIDEIPQLFNVLKGEMSIVGPRPERPVFVNQFKKENPHYKYRHLVKPGITGLAQVLAKYKTSADDKLRYDLYYIRNYSFLLDLIIIFLTIKAILTRESSSGVDEAEEVEDLLNGIKVLTHNEIAATKDK
ncbi:MAG: sugar transferase [Thermosediminibacteraceae bacterium]|nr:sugar transferase [Thermosediminibacteraceae bacterium]